MKHAFSRRRFLTALAAAAAGASIPRRLAGQDKPRKPNFIIFIGDDVGWGDAGCYGHPHIRTPNVDALAREGLKFEYAFLPCSSCSPSRCSVMTGRYPHSHGAPNLHEPLPADQIVFADLLRKAGYYSAAAGKWHLGDAAKVNFDHIVDSQPSGCEKWVETLRQRPKDKPFFLWLASHDAHRPYSANTLPQPHGTDDVVVPPFLPDAAETRKDLALYYDEVSRLDGYIGKVMAELKAQGIDEDTFVLYMSDNGRPFPRCKTTTYDSGVGTPLIVRWPGRVKGGAVTESLASSVDIAPTIIELAGLETSPTFQGKSFAPILADPRTETRRFVFAEHNWHDYQAHERSVRDRKYLYIRNAFPQLPGTPPADAVSSITYRKMIELEAAGKLPPEQRGCFVKPRPVEELYEVDTDRDQLRNLADQPARAETLARMRQAMDEWIRETGDAVPADPKPDGYDRTTGQRLGGGKKAPAEKKGRKQDK